jgi:hypothetical protein
MRKKKRTAPRTLHWGSIGRIREQLERKDGPAMMRQKELCDRRLFQSRRIRPAQLFFPLFLIHVGIGNPEQLIE